MLVYLDASALVKVYVAEADSDQVQRLLRGRSQPTTCRHSHVEVVSALWRRARAGEISETARDRAAATLERLLARMKVVEVTPAVTGRAVELVQRHPLRAGDAVQLASALHLAAQSGRTVRFLCYDGALTAAARAELRGSPEVVRGLLTRSSPPRPAGRSPGGRLRWSPRAAR